jgi:glutathione S-transferase
MTKKGFYRNNLPVMTIDGKAYPQSGALLRYVGKLSNLYPVDFEEALICDAIIETVNDILNVAPVLSPLENEDDENITGLMTEYWVIYNEYGSKKLRYNTEDIEALLKQSGGPFCTGSRLSIADFWLYNCVAMTKACEAKEIDESHFDDYPRISSLFDKISQIEAVKTHITYPPF